VAQHDLYARSPRRRPRAETGISRRELLRLRMSPAARSDIDFAGVTERVVAGWERDGHEPLLRALEPASELLVDLAGVEARARVLDVGAGDGNVALACSRRGAVVEACDLAAAMVERGRARCPGAGWTVADAQALPYPDGAFDVVLSSFGVVLAPRWAHAARELARVARPGGTVGLTAFVPRGLPGRMDELVEALAPLPDGVAPPSRWGREAVARGRLERLLEGLELRTRILPLSFPDADALFEALARPCPLDDAGRRALRPDFDRLLASRNDVSHAVELSGRYLVALGRRPR